MEEEIYDPKGDRKYPLAVADIYCDMLRLVVRIMGKKHSTSDVIIRKDKDQKKRLVDLGFCVIDFWWNEMLDLFSDKAINTGCICDIVESISKNYKYPKIKSRKIYDGTASLL